MRSLKMKNSPPYWVIKDFIELPNSIILARAISDGAKITLAFLLNYTDRDEIKISHGRIAEELGKSDGTINKHFKELEKNGYIVLHRRAGYSSQILFTAKSKSSEEIKSHVR